ncbi:hypothetical protein V5O48_010970 [Marasmius crinis-equi]|uniref:Uncharacterized protein n=1 Tax=Marasmius crinis-equi TaxID=585013 RepID=A0ABR3F6Y6_9AGAR
MRSFERDLETEDQAQIADGRGGGRQNNKAVEGLVPGESYGDRASQVVHDDGLGNHLRGTTDITDDERIISKHPELAISIPGDVTTKSILVQKDVEDVPSKPDSEPEPFPSLSACQNPPSPTISTADDASPLHRGSIRFMPRVRITSGLNGSTRQRSSTSESVSPTTGRLNSPLNGPTSTQPQPQPQPPSLASTRSSSISSSISAPLRFREQEPVPSKWGPLGQRVSLFASQKKRKRRSLNDAKSAWDDLCASPDEAEPPRGLDEYEESTPLLLAPGLRRRVDEDVAADLNREIDAVFGKWPGRLMNRHWWWWQIEPVVCCWWCANDDWMFDE